MNARNHHIAEMTAALVSAYVGSHTVSKRELPTLIVSIRQTLDGIVEDGGRQWRGKKLTPAVPLRKAVYPDYVVDLFTGKRFTSLKRHLRTAHKMTPEDYREFWGLPKDSPMVAPNYSASRSAFAKSIGLGRGAHGAASGKAEPKG